MQDLISRLRSKLVLNSDPAWDRMEQQLRAAERRLAPALAMGAVVGLSLLLWLVILAGASFWFHAAG